ncbi:MAG: response regulator [Chloroflexi bacterium]|nr:response regulator [Chloroflexota bacterium]
MAKGQVLIIEDEEIVRDSMRRVLADAGYHADAVPSAAAGLSRLAHQAYDLLLVDMKLPNTDGLAFLREVRARDPLMGAVVVTGYGTLEDSSRAMELGALGFVLKPASPQRLLAVVEDAIHRQRVAEETHRTRALALLLDLSRLAARESDAERLLTTTLNVLDSYAGATRSAVLLLDETASSLRRVNSRNVGGFNGLSPYASAQLVQRWLHQPDPVLFPTEGVHSLALAERELASAGISRGICAPLVALGQVMGALVLGIGASHPGLRGSDVGFLTVACGILANAAHARQLAARAAAEATEGVA